MGIPDNLRPNSFRNCFKGNNCPIINGKWQIRQLEKMLENYQREAMIKSLFFLECQGLEID